MERFFAAQNAHDPEVVKDTLLDSPEFLRGHPSERDADPGRDGLTAQKFQAFYKGTWTFEPDMAQFRIMSLLGSSQRRSLSRSS